MKRQGLIKKVLSVSGQLACLVAVLGAIITTSAVVASANGYSVTNIGNFSPKAINNSGQVVVSYNSGFGYLSYLFSNGTLTEIGNTANGFYAQGLNNSGQVVGVQGNNDGHFSAAVLSNGIISSLGTLYGPFSIMSSQAFGINDFGQAIGSAEVGFPITECNGSTVHAVLFTNGTVTDLGSLGKCNPSQAYSINNSGQAVGMAYYANGDQRAALFSNGVVTDLGTLGGSQSFAWSINDSGQVVGAAATNGNAPLHAALFSNGTVTDLGALEGGSSEAYSINNNGQVVGSSLSRAVIFSNGSVTDLNTLVKAPLVTLTEAIGINDSGQILAHDVSSNAYLLTPINPPGPPANVTATSADGQATVSFTPPSNQGGSPITSYTVTANPGSISVTRSISPFSPITIAGLTNSTAYIFSVTAANNDGPGPAATATNLDWLDVTLNGTGSGSVNSAPNGISCSSGTCGDNYNPVLPINQVTLTPSASNGSQFTGWGGACTGVGACNVTMDPLYQSVSATFDVLQNAQIVGSPQVYGLLQSAYDDATAVAVIHSKGVTFAENLTLVKPKAVVLGGGFDANFSTQSGLTILQGSLAISQGSLRVDHFAIK